MINGVTFYFLDGDSQGFAKILFNLESYKPKVANLLSELSKGGVNWLRLLIVCQHFGKSTYHPDDIYDKPGIYIQKVNEFMKFARTIAPFTFEVMLDPRKEAPPGYFEDPTWWSYEHDKAWLVKWIVGIDYTSLGLIMLPGDIYPVQDNQGFGDHLELVSPIAYNHGYWIKDVLNYLHSKYPNLHLNFEMGLWGTSPETIQKAVQWHNKYFPWTWWIAMPLYYSLPPGATWQEYKAGFLSLFSAYKKSTSKPLWIDEIGFPILHPAGGYDEEDQEAYYYGALDAMKSVGFDKARFVWVVGNDYPYGMKHGYGLVKSFVNNNPVWNLSWEQVKTYYK